MLKKKLGVEAVEMDWGSMREIEDYFKISSILAIPEGCESIGFAVFMSCHEILKEVIIPESVKVIGDSAFMYCDNLRKVIIPENVERICNSAFYGCSRATIILEKLESEFKEIEAYSFNGCKDVKEEIRS